MEGNIFETMYYVTSAGFLLKAQYSPVYNERRFSLKEIIEHIQLVKIPMGKEIMLRHALESGSIDVARFCFTRI
jgi:hypothetical protein